jgi:hypothetical protein
MAAIEREQNEEKRQREEPLRPRFCLWLDEREQIVKKLRAWNTAKLSETTCVSIHELADAIEAGEHWKKL